ncbi:MAG: DUF1653 domain-containing protein [Candidatus Moranbacteria bacterium]|jgi:hypothetical protein|nr:DUF1653 domain-containing protein [Candidatus Moranbacteria bacterium]MDD5652192.1 DUF1653 domain-containing protein [Candidatus Moranbacteria bacterium]MDX9855530.1 DUF1653 domain-containing protein [Candidatus Moranbacteria bacterium]
MTELKIGIYKHYKGGEVKVLHIASHSETLDKYVVYEALYECRTHGKGSIWVRPLSMFQENVKVDGKEIPRFKFIK